MSSTRAFHFTSDFSAHAQDVLLGAFNTGRHADVTLACPGDPDSTHRVEAHKLILSAGSAALRRRMEREPETPILVLDDICPSTLDHILTFIYTGEVTMSREDAEAFVVAAQDLEVVGLSPVATGEELPLRKKVKTEPGTMNTIAENVEAKPDKPIPEDLDGVVKLANGKAQCLQCNKILCNIRNAKEHYRVTHIHVDKAKCPICKTEAKNASSLRVHISRIHKMKMSDLRRVEKVKVETS